jgi:hypothetical protein
MVSDGYRADDGIVESNPGMVTDNHITDSIVDTGARLNDRITA